MDLLSQDEPGLRENLLHRAKLVHLRTTPLTRRPWLVFVEHGLNAATEDLVDRMPVLTTLDLTLTDPLPAPVQSTAYFVIAEALANAVKHSAAGIDGVDELA